MKRSIYCLLAVLGTVAACNREAIDGTEETEKPGSTATTVKVHAGGAGTRTSIRHDDGKYVVGWKAGDKLAVLEGIPAIAQLVERDSDFNQYACLLYDTEELVEDTDNAEFTLKLDERDYTSGEIQYVAIYPASAAIDVAGDAWDYDARRPIATIDFPREQKPTADSFDPAADVLVSKVVTNTGRPSELSFQFARVGAIVKMVLNGLPVGAVIQSGHVELGIEAGYYMKYDPVDEKMIISDGTDGISFSYGENGLVVGDDRAVTVWLRCMSGVSNSIYLELYGTTADGDDLERTRRINLRAKGKPLAFQEGGLTTFTVDLKKPDVPNPAVDDIDFRTTTDDHDGVEVFWPDPKADQLASYDCFLIDEAGTRHDFTGLNWNESVFGVFIDGGLAPGTYTFFIRALAQEGWVSQQDYVEKELEIGIPLTLNINYMSAHNPNSDDNFDLALDYSIGQDYFRDKYRDVDFYLRNLSWHGGSPNHFDGDWYDDTAWIFASASPHSWTKLTVTTVPGYPASDYRVLFSDSEITNDDDLIYAGDVSGTVISDCEETFDLGNHRYFLITGGGLHIYQISLEYYK